MNESYRFTISRNLKLYFDHVHDVFEITADVLIPNPPYTSSNFYAKIWEVGMEEAGLIVELIRNSLEEPLPDNRLPIPDYGVFSIKKISDTVFRLNIYTSENTFFWTHITSEQVNELLTIMQRIHDTLAKGQE